MPIESNSAGTRIVKAENPLRKENVPETRARPVAWTVAMSA
jgi:hypothetical protein